MLFQMMPLYRQVIFSLHNHMIHGQLFFSQVALFFSANHLKRSPDVCHLRAPSGILATLFASEFSWLKVKIMAKLSADIFMANYSLEYASWYWMLHHHQCFLSKP